MMDIKEIKKEKKIARVAIQSILVKLEEQTGTIITGISVTRAYDIIGGSEVGCIRLKMEVE